jgi:Undecaprenyl-phosphate galactose phosphotransferase WbaP
MESIVQNQSCAVLVRAEGAQRTARPGLTGAALLAADMTAVLLAGFAAVGLWAWWQPAVDAAVYLRLWPAALAYLAAYAFLGLYPGVGLGPVEELRRLTLATTLVSLAGTAALVLARETGFSRGVLLGAWALTLIAVPVSRAALRTLCAARWWWGTPVVVLGAGLAGRAVVRRLQSQPELGLKPVAFFDDDPEKPPAFDGVPLAGPLSSAPGWSRERRIHYALIAMPSLRRPELLAVLERCGSSFRHVIVLPDLFGMASLWVNARDLGGVLGLEIRQNLLSPANRGLKRLLDLAIALPAAAVALPIVLAAAVWIRRVSPGSPFFVQERGGEGGRSIRVYKLRTMRPDADRILDRYLAQNPEAWREWQRCCKLRKDPRLLPRIGKLLRRTSLDELPQLWNVLKGEMSLIGPRPFPAYHLERFPPEFRALRARVRPGITGLWQVSARSDGDLEVQQALDAYYIRNWSLWLDLHILARTIRAVLAARGAY